MLPHNIKNCYCGEWQWLTVSDDKEVEGPVAEQPADRGYVGVLFWRDATSCGLCLSRRKFGALLED